MEISKFYFLIRREADLFQRRFFKKGLQSLLTISVGDSNTLILATFFGFLRGRGVRFFTFVEILRVYYLIATLCN